MKPVKKTLGRSNQNLLAYSRIISGTCADTEPAGAVPGSVNRNIHGKDTFFFKNGVQCIVGIPGKSHSPAEIIARAGGNIAKDNIVKVCDACKNFMDGAVTSHSDKPYRVIRGPGRRDLPGKGDGMSYISGEISGIGNPSALKDAAQPVPDIKACA